MENNDQAFFEQMAREDLLSFCVFNDQFFSALLPHLEKIAEHLRKVEAGEIMNLIISMPPRAGKSRIMQEWIANLYGRSPNTDILYTGHSLSLLEGFSRNIRNRIQSEEYKALFDTRIASDSSAVKNWSIKNGGEFAIYGVGGGITGKGGNILIIDDPYASRQDAESDTVRRTVSNWYWSTFVSRKQSDKARQIIIMQRWREDDLVGEILEKEGENWVELKIPALDENGESFWAERFDREYFEDIKKKSPLFFMSQYQQNPIPSEGGDFNKENFIRGKPTEEQIARMNIATFLDPAISQKQDADFSAIVTVGQDTESNFRYVLEVKKLKALPDEIISELFDTARTWNNRGKSYKAGIEIVQYQKMLALAVKNRMRELDEYFILEEVNPRGEKEARIRSILQPLYSAGNMVHTETANVDDLEIELLKFPNGKHDDMIDALASAVSIIGVQSIQKQKMKVYVPSYPGT